MEKTPKKNTTRSRCEAEHDVENSDNGNDDGNYCDDDKENDVNLAGNSFLFTEFGSSTDLLTKQFEKPLLNAKIQIFL